MLQVLGMMPFERNPLFQQFSELAEDLNIVCDPNQLNLL